MERQTQTPTTRGPAEWFTADVYVDAIASPAGWRSLNLDGGRLVQRGRQGRHMFPDRATTKVLPGRRGGKR